MSWLNRLNELELEIITGDGKSYKPLWRNASRNINFNTEGFEFVGVEGTYVQREKKSGTQYPILLYFKGENCIEQASAFEISSRDSRPWVIKHPFYDEIKVQPLNLEFDDSQYNVSVITGVVWETLDEKFPKEKILPSKKIEIDKLSSDEIIVENYDVKPKSNLIKKATSAIESIDLNYQPLITDSETAVLLKNLVSAAGAAAIDLVSLPLNFIRETQALINFPFQVIQSVENKLGQLIESALSLANIFIPDSEQGAIDNIDLVTYNALASTTITQFALVTTETQNNEFNKRKDIVSYIEQLSDLYTETLLLYDDNAFSQNDEIALSVDNLVNTTLINLYDIAFNAQQERSIILEKDDNIINLSHRFYGGGDDNITKFIEENDISRRELLQVKKGRLLKWYV